MYRESPLSMKCPLAFAQVLVERMDTLVARMEAPPRPIADPGRSEESFTPPPHGPEPLEVDAGFSSPIESVDSSAPSMTPLHAGRGARSFPSPRAR